MDDPSTRLHELNDTGFESFVRLSAYRGTQPPLADLRSDLEPHIERAIERSSY